jgi:UDP-2,3-diacylglucosamine hydrolase
LKNGVHRVRYVLPDWDCDAMPQRGGWLAIQADGTVERIALDGKVQL